MYNTSGMYYLMFIILRARKLWRASPLGVVCSARARWIRHRLNGYLVLQSPSLRRGTLKGVPNCTKNSFVVPGHRVAKVKRAEISAVPLLRDSDPGKHTFENFTARTHIPRLLAREQQLGTRWAKNPFRRCR